MFQPRYYQADCLKILNKVREKGTKHALVVMASGLGKTVTMAFDALNFRKQFPSARVLYLCHQNQIACQARTTFEVVNGQGCTYGYYNGTEKTAHSVDFLFASFQTMRKRVGNFSPDEFDYVVVDESHHTYGETYLDVVNYWKPKFLLGMTATPDRTDGQDIRKVFGREVFFLPLEEALAQGLLTPVDYRLMTDEIRLKKAMELSGRRLNLRMLNRSIFVPRRDEEIVRLIRKHSQEFEQPRVVVFCQSVEYCERLAKIMPGAMTLHSKMSLRERSIRTELFRQGIITTLLTIDVFNEGIDIPEANVLVFLRTTVSPVVFFQQLGRGLRLFSGKDKVLVLDFVANCERIQMVRGFAKKVREQILKKAGRRQASPMLPFELNIDDPTFDERVVRVFEIISRIGAEFYPTWQEASAATVKLGIKSQIDYVERYRDDPKLPSNPRFQYPDFPGFTAFLGKKKRVRYKTWQEASAAALKVGIKIPKQYRKLYKKDTGLSAVPDRYYQDFPGWAVFLGRAKKQDLYLTWQEASSSAKSLGPMTRLQYFESYKKDPKLPNSPHTKYPDFPGWDVFLGRV